MDEVGGGQEAVGTGWVGVDDLRGGAMRGKRGRLATAIQAGRIRAQAGK